MNNIIYKNFIDHNKKLFSLKGKKNDKKIYIEFNGWACSHIAISNCLLALKKNFNYNVVAYPENGLQYFLNKKSILNKSKFYFGKKLGLKNFGIYKSFSTDNFLNIENKKIFLFESNFIFKKILKKIKTKSDILNIKIKNILVGDLIYDSFLKEYKKETIIIKDKIFFDFLKKSIEYFLFWYYEFKNNKIKAVISSQSVYLSSLPIRIGIFHKCVCLVTNPERLYRLSKKMLFSDKEFLLFNKTKLKISKKLMKRGLSLSKKRLNSRFKGKVGVDLSYLSKTAYGRIKSKKVLKNNKKYKILIAPHSFSDAPHQLGKHLFPDYFEWLNFILQNANTKKFDWYIKCHPNFVEYFDNTIKIIKNFTKKFKFLNYLDPNVSHRQLIHEGINAAITCHGTIGSEYPFFGIPVINASNSNPHINYKFNFHPKNSTELKKILNDIDRTKIKINKNKLLEYYFLKNIYFSNKWLFNNIDDLIKFSNGYKNIYGKKSYEFWLKKWNIKKQNSLTEAISKFIDSKDYMMTFKHYKLNLKEHLNENSF